MFILLTNDMDASQMLELVQMFRNSIGILSRGENNEL